MQIILTSKTRRARPSSPASPNVYAAAIRPFDQDQSYALRSASVIASRENESALVFAADQATDHRKIKFAIAGLDGLAQPAVRIARSAGVDCALLREPQRIGQILPRILGRKGALGELPVSIDFMPWLRSAKLSADPLDRVSNSNCGSTLERAPMACASTMPPLFQTAPCC